MMKELLKGKSPEIKARMKAEALYKAAESLKLPKGIIIEQSGIGTLTADGIADDDKHNTIWFKISVNGKYLNNDGWYGFRNPPIIVNGKENLKGVLKSIILEAVKWQP